MIECDLGNWRSNVLSHPDISVIIWKHIHDYKWWFPNRKCRRLVRIWESSCWRIRENWHFWPENQWWSSIYFLIRKVCDDRSNKISHCDSMLKHLSLGICELHFYQSSKTVVRPSPQVIAVTPNECGLINYQRLAVWKTSHVESKQNSSTKGFHHTVFDRFGGGRKISGQHPMISWKQTASCSTFVFVLFPVNEGMSSTGKI